MKYVVFLDFDGVLNSRGYFHTDAKYLEYLKRRPKAAEEDPRLFMRMHLDIAALRNLRFLMNNLPPDKEIIISSSWGRVYTKGQIRTAFRAKGFGDLAKLIKDITPRKMSSYRCNEIGWMLSKYREYKNYHGKIRWITIDDYPIFSKDYLETVIYLDEGVRLEYDPEYHVDNQNGLTYTDVLAILTVMTPGFQPKMDPI